MHEVLRLAGLRVRIRGEELVRGVDLRVSAGESVALIGASGSGKSLTCSAIIGDLSPELDAEGDLDIDGEPLDVHSMRRPRGVIAWVKQDSARALNPLERAGRQLRVPLLNRGFTSADADREAADLLARSGIEDPRRVLQSYPAELSGGQRQRVCIALALAGQAKLLIADEPTTALDVVSQAQVIDVLRTARDANPDLALLFVTHDIAVASHVCERVVRLDDGRVTAAGSFADVLAVDGVPHVLRSSDRLSPVAVGDARTQVTGA